MARDYLHLLIEGQRSWSDGISLEERMGNFYFVLSWVREIWTQNVGINFDVYCYLLKFSNE